MFGFKAKAKGRREEPLDIEIGSSLEQEQENLLLEDTKSSSSSLGAVTSLHDELKIEQLEGAADSVVTQDIILDEDSALREAKSQERLKAQEKDILTLKEEKKSKSAFALIGHNLVSVQNDDDNLLRDEKTDLGKIEAEDFITGNVTVIKQNLRTGTDNLLISSSANAVSAFDDELESGSDITHELDFSDNQLHCSITLSLPSNEQDQEEEPFLPMLLREFGEHWLTYGLAIVVCLLCLLKVYQVQETRDLTARLNEVVVSNADLEKQWLVLVASRQKLSEHSKIKTFAREKLLMVSPKIQNENVISLHKK